MVALLKVIVDAWAVVAVHRRPSAAFARSGRNKALWLVIALVGVSVCNTGLLVPLWYLLIVDPEVRRMGHLGDESRFPSSPGDRA